MKIMLMPSVMDKKMGEPFKNFSKVTDKIKWSLKILLIILAVLFLIKMVIAVRPSKLDFGLYRAFAHELALHGPDDIYAKYTPRQLPYGPGYLYCLWISGSVTRLFGQSFSGSFVELAIKFWSVISDLVGALFIYLIARKLKKEKLGTLLAIIYALNPGVVFVSSYWGQFDTFTATLLLLMVYCFLNDLDISAVVIFTIAVLTKQQSIFLLPIPIILFFKHFSFKKLLLAIIACFSTFIAITLPFADGNHIFWFFERTIDFVKSGYPYATANTFNIWMVLGGQARQVTDIFYSGFTYADCANAYLFLVIGLAVWGLVRQKIDDFKVYFTSFFLYFGVVMVWSNMHERHFFPILIFITICILYDRRLWIPMLTLSISYFANVFYVLYRSDLPDVSIWMPQGDPIALFFSWLNIIIFAYCTYYYVKRIVLTPASKDVTAYIFT